MERRKFVIGLGSLAAGGAAATGTGAFTTAEVDRSFDVEVSGDATAYTALKSNNNYTYLDSSPEKLVIDMSEDNPYVLGDGINDNSQYTFSALFTIENRGDQTRAFWIDDSSMTHSGYLKFYPEGEGDRKTLEGAPDDESFAGQRTAVLDPGESVDVSLSITMYSDDNKTRSANPGDFDDGSITVMAGEPYSE